MLCQHLLLFLLQYISVCEPHLYKIKANFQKWTGKWAGGGGAAFAFWPWGRQKLLTCWASSFLLLLTPVFGLYLCWNTFIYCVPVFRSSFPAGCIWGGQPLNWDLTVQGTRRVNKAVWRVVLWEAKLHFFKRKQVPCFKGTAVWVDSS